MRTPILSLLLILALAPPCAGQVAKSASPEAQRANRHYKNGWDSMRSEAWAEAVREFQQAIDIDPKFTLAYYSLGRAEMGLRDFPKAIAAYLRCRELYVGIGGERFTNQLAASRSLDDRILEYRSAIAAAQNSGLKAQSQSTALYIRELQAQIDRMEQARQRHLDTPIDASVPYFVPMALGAAYFRSGQAAEAEREYKTALDANPGSGETHSNLAVLYLTTDRLDQAAREIKLAEDTGFKVNSNLKDDISKRKRGG
jgi:tetratricopeptide (TPR) repeat protein